MEKSQEWRWKLKVNRAERREYERKIKEALKTISQVKAKKLNVDILEWYFTEQAKAVADNTWGVINAELQRIMREEKISMDRMDRIFKKLNESMIEKDKESFMQPIPHTVFMPKSHFEDLAELVFCRTCKNCPDMKKECEVRKIMKWQGVPENGWNLKCEYAYK